MTIHPLRNQGTTIFFSHTPSAARGSLPGSEPGRWISYQRVAKLTISPQRAQSKRMVYIMARNYGDGMSDRVFEYEQLPVPVARIEWSRGRKELAPLLATDPGIYLGGWRAAFEYKRTQNGTTSVERAPIVPMPVVARAGNDGDYLVYACNKIMFFPIRSRTRYEFGHKEKTTYGEKFVVDSVVATHIKGSGGKPKKEIFGLVFGMNAETKKVEYSPALIVVNHTWNTKFDLERVHAEAKKVKAPEGQGFAWEIGTNGKDANGKTIPILNVAGEATTTPIELLNATTPFFFDITPDIDALFDASEAWQKCPTWNAEGARAGTSDNAGVVTHANPPQAAATGFMPEPPSDEDDPDFWNNKTGQ